MHHLSRALATARIDDPHRDAAYRRTIRLARGVAHEPHRAPASGVQIVSGRRWTAVATAVLAAARLPMSREMRSVRGREQAACTCVLAKGAAAGRLVRISPRVVRRARLDHQTVVPEVRPSPRQAVANALASTRQRGRTRCDSSRRYR
jgi:hypothetical protein